MRSQEGAEHSPLGGVWHLDAWLPKTRPTCSQSQGGRSPRACSGEGRLSYFLESAGTGGIAPDSLFGPQLVLWPGPWSVGSLVSPPSPEIRELQKRPVSAFQGPVSTPRPFPDTLVRQGAIFCWVLHDHLPRGGGGLQQEAAQPSCLAGSRTQPCSPPGPRLPARRGPGPPARAFPDWNSCFNLDQGLQTFLERARECLC